MIADRGRRGRVFLLAAGILVPAGCSTERTFGGYDYSHHTWSTATGIKVEDRVSGKLLYPEDALTLEYRGDI